MRVELTAGGNREGFSIRDQQGAFIASAVGDAEPRLRGQGKIGFQRPGRAHPEAPAEAAAPGGRPVRQVTPQCFFRENIKGDIQERPLFLEEILLPDQFGGIEGIMLHAQGTAERNLPGVAEGKVVLSIEKAGCAHGHGAVVIELVRDQGAVDREGFPGRDGDCDADVIVADAVDRRICRNGQIAHERKVRSAVDGVLQILHGAAVRVCRGNQTEDQQKAQEKGKGVTVRFVHGQFLLFYFISQNAYPHSLPEL